MPDGSQSSEPATDDGTTEGSEASNGASSSAEVTVTPRRRRAARRAFPATSFNEALFLANAIQAYGSGQPIRRLTLFEALDRSPDSGATRRIITSSNQYAITKGAYNADVLSLTSLGATASDPNSAPAAQLAARAELAITKVAPFKAIYEQYKDSRVPAPEVLRDAARLSGVDENEVAECVETFLANARDLGLIRNIGGSEHLISIDAAVSEETDTSGDGASPEVYEGNVEVLQRPERPSTRTDGSQILVDTLAAATTDLSSTCFIISPIGAVDSVERKHADLVLSALIEPALAQLGLVPVRADKISKPGMITGQVIEHLCRAKLVIADLSFGNPNVYYELALRHATRKAVVQIIRTSDRLPFDVGQFRTVAIDMTDIYTLVPQLDLHRQEIARQCRAALEEGAVTENPLSLFYSKFWEQISVIA